MAELRPLISKRDAQTESKVRVKGVNFIMLLEAVVRIYGPEAKQRIEKGATGDLAHVLRFGGIVTSGWYSLSLYRSLWHLVASQLTLDTNGIRRLTQKATALSIGGIYRTLAQVTTPAMLVSLSSKIFGKFYESAQFNVKTSRQGYILCEWRECDGFDRYLWNHVIGGAVYFLEVAGAKSVEFSVLEGGDDSNRMLAAFTYT